MVMQCALQPVQLQNGLNILGTEASDAQTLLLIVPGSGSLEPGYWSSPGLNEKMGPEVGTPLLMVQAAVSHGWSVLCANPNLNHTPDGKPLEGSFTPEEHIQTVWDSIVASEQYSNVVIAAHSQGDLGSLILPLTRLQVLLE